jgi:hypothetical protein
MNKDDVSRYIDLYSGARFEEAVTSYFTEDASFWNTRIALRGTAKIIDWLTASHLGYGEKLTPVSMIVESKGAAVELAQEFHANEDLSHFFIRPMKFSERAACPGSWSSEMAKSAHPRNTDCCIKAIPACSWLRR